MGGVGVLGIDLLLACVVAFVVLTAVLSARRGGEAAARRRARAAVGAALGAGGPDAVADAVRQLARLAPGESAAAAEALVLASRESYRRELIPLLVALLGHRAKTAAAAAALALNDLGAPGLRSAWEALGERPELRAGCVAFLTEHPDWLFERLLDTFVTAGAPSVARYRDLWQQPGVQHRLALLEGGSDAVNRLRAHTIRELLSGNGNRVA